MRYRDQRQLHASIGKLIVKIPDSTVILGSITNDAKQMADEWNGLRNERWLLEGLLNAQDVSDGLVQTGGDENGQQHESNAGFHRRGHVRSAEVERRESVRVPTYSDDGEREQGADGILLISNERGL